MDALVLYVAIDGDDRWSGTRAEPDATGDDGPFASLTRARDAVRALRAEQPLSRPVEVLVRGGKYFLPQTFTLGPEDSGTRACPIRYLAYPGETPILSGGRPITGWQVYDGAILQASLPGARGGKWKFRQLFFNGRRQTRARYPNRDPENPLYGGWALTEGPADDGTIRARRFDTGVEWYVDSSKEGGQSRAFAYKPGTFSRRWAKPTEGEINIFPMDDWTNSIIPIQAVDEQRRIITLQREVPQFDRSPWYAATGIRANNRFIVENLLEELDQPGEWCLDSEDGVVYFWPPEPITTAEVCVPALDCLIDIRGAAWLVIAGFTFTETLDGDDLHREGNDGYGAMFIRQGLRYCGDALHLKRAEHCRIEGNHFYAVGGNAIYLEGHNARNTIQGNEVSEAGANGICLVGSVSQHPQFNAVLDNQIHHCGVLLKYVAGVFLGASTGNVIGHNAIHHMPHHAINLGSNGLGRNIVEYNEIRFNCLEIHDNGAINSWGDVPITGVQREIERSGHVIRYNLIADTYGCHVRADGTITAPDVRLTQGIYLDDYTSNCFVYGNIIIRAGTGIYVHGGKHNVIENNILVDCKYHFRLWDHVSTRRATLHMAGFMSSNRFYRNIGYSRREDGYLFHLGLWNDRLVAQSEANIFWNPARDALLIDDCSSGDTFMDGVALPLDGWRERGLDETSLAADPLFVDAEHDNYELQPDSPALALGFEPLALDAIGPRPLQIEGLLRKSPPRSAALAP